MEQRDSGIGSLGHSMLLLAIWGLVGGGAVRVAGFLSSPPPTNSNSTGSSSSLFLSPFSRDAGPSSPENQAGEVLSWFSFRSDLKQDLRVHTMA